MRNETLRAARSTYSMAAKETPEMTTLCNRRYVFLYLDSKTQFDVQHLEQTEIHNEQRCDRRRRCCNAVAVIIEVKGRV